MQDKRICTQCKKEKSVKDFEKDSRYRDNLRRKCRECRNLQRRESYSRRFPKGKRRPRNWAKEAEYAKGKRRRHIAKYLIQSAKRRASAKSLPFDLDMYEEEVIARVKPMRCELSGIQLKMADGQRDFDSISMDRIVPEKGYVITNIRFVCWAINAAAGHWGLSRMMEIMDKIPRE
jgi:hypothetical protein